MSIRIVPCFIRDANILVKQWHRHHKPVTGGLFAVAVADGDRICGAAIISRPIARRLQDGFTAEVTRCVTDGTQNACSMLEGRVHALNCAIELCINPRALTEAERKQGEAVLKARGELPSPPKESEKG